MAKNMALYNCEQQAIIGTYNELANLYSSNHIATGDQRQLDPDTNNICS